MVKVSTLFYRVDGFEELNASSTFPDILEQDLGDQFLQDIFGQLILDPGENLVKTVLEKA